MGDIDRLVAELGEVISVLKQQTALLGYLGTRPQPGQPSSAGSAAAGILADQTGIVVPVPLTGSQIVRAAIAANVPGVQVAPQSVRVYTAPPASYVGYNNDNFLAADNNNPTLVMESRVHLSSDEYTTASFFVAVTLDNGPGYPITVPEPRDADLTGHDVYFTKLTVAYLGFPPGVTLWADFTTATMTRAFYSDIYLPLLAQFGLPALQNTAKG